MTAGITFFTISDNKYFPGLVGLLNSLQKHGYSHLMARLVVGDCGLTARQRELLAPHCVLFHLSRDLVRNPLQYKAFARLLNPEGIIAVIDSDMIVTGDLTGISSTAEKGKICVFPDIEKDRWFPEWQEMFSLRSPLRRQLYANSGFVAFSTRHWPQLLERWWAACECLFQFPTMQEGATGPFAQTDQDALNALLMSEFPADAVSFQPAQLEVFGAGGYPPVRLIDRHTLRCRYRGQEPLILHACGSPKPWQRAGVRNGAYLSLLRRLLTAPDVALSLPERVLDIWLRQGTVPDLVCSGLSFANLPRRTIARVRRRLGG